MARNQRDKMRELLQTGLTDDEIVKEYAVAERRGEVVRKSDRNGLSAEHYGRKVLSNTRNHDARKAARTGSSRP